MKPLLIRPSKKIPPPETAALNNEISELREIIERQHVEIQRLKSTFPVLIEGARLLVPNGFRDPKEGENFIRTNKDTICGPVGQITIKNHNQEPWNGGSRQILKEIDISKLTIPKDAYILIPGEERPLVFDDLFIGKTGSDNGKICKHLTGHNNKTRVVLKQVKVEDYIQQLLKEGVAQNST